jgi:hypothetical protein
LGLFGLRPLKKTSSWVYSGYALKARLRLGFIRATPSKKDFVFSKNNFLYN